MKDFSEQRTSPCEGLHLPHISALLGLLQGWGVRNRGYIKRRFLEGASQFERTLDFLREIGAVRDHGDELIVNPAWAVPGGRIAPEEVATMLMDRLVRRETPFRREVFDYVTRFRVEGGRAVYRPSAEERGADSGVRNLLMELGVVAFDSTKNEYVLMPEHVVVLAHARHCRRSALLVDFDSARRSREDLGLAAEETILAYEHERVGAGLADEIDHVALRNVAAGYDIRSVSVTEAKRILPRYIEVKAVPAGTLRFYWTANEVRVAQLFSSWYYLYLLPVDRQGAFDMPHLRIIAEPHCAVLGSASGWIVESDVIQCSLAFHSDSTQPKTGE